MDVRTFAAEHRARMPAGDRLARVAGRGELRYAFEELSPAGDGWAEVQGFGGLNVFQTRPWVEYVAAEHHGEPVLVRVLRDGAVAGHFVGLKVHEFGVGVLGSPFRGWGAYFMGFNLGEGVATGGLLPALTDWAWHHTGCQFLEVVDPHLTGDDVADCPHARVEPLHWYAVDLTPTEDELFASFRSQCRNCIRKAAKSGVVIEEARGVGFADEYYAQHLEVMARLDLQPTYSLESLRRMIETMLPTGNILLLRSREPGGESIATGIFLSAGDAAVFWGAASRREFQSLRPNEVLAWHGIRAMKARGARTFHFGGECDQYKEKFGTTDAGLVRITCARNAVLAKAFDVATSKQDPAYRNWILRHI